MRHAPVNALGLILAVILLGACGGGDDDPEPAATTASTSASGSGATPVATADGGNASTPAGGAGDRGSATLTVGDETWEFDSFGCAFGHAATRSDEYSFSSDSRGQHTNGNNLQMQVNIRDESGQGRYEGDGVAYEINIDDITDFQNPSVNWSSTTPIFTGMPDGETLVTIDGDRVTGEGLFFEGDDFAGEAVPGTFEGTCGAQSIR